MIGREALTEYITKKSSSSKHLRKSKELIKHAKPSQGWWQLTRKLSLLSIGCLTAQLLDVTSLTQIC